MLSSRDHSATIAAHFKVPAHIEAAANAVRYDLMHGPSWVRIPQGDVTKFTDDDHATFRDDIEDEEGDTVAETYTSAVADALREYIDGLPSELWVDTFAGCISEGEPEAWQDDETGEWIEPEWSDYIRADADDIVTALFGRTIAREFR